MYKKKIQKIAKMISLLTMEYMFKRFESLLVEDQFLLHLLLFGFIYVGRKIIEAKTSKTTVDATQPEQPAPIATTDTKPVEAEPAPADTTNSTEKVSNRLLRFCILLIDYTKERHSQICATLLISIETIL